MPDNVNQAITEQPKYMGIQAGQAALNVGQGVLGTALGYIFGRANDKRQLRQQELLNRQALASNKEMALFNYDQQMKLWENTNYAAQKEQMQKAGLNPSLMYGMTGGGGTTAAAAQGTGVSTAHAPVGGGEVMNILEQQLQMRMTQAQVKLAEAQANKTNVEANKIEGVDTSLTNAQINSLIQNAKTQKEQELLTQAQRSYQNLQNQLAGNTLQSNIDIAKQNLQNLETQGDILVKENQLAGHTLTTKVKIIEQEYLKLIADTELQKQLKQLAKSNIALNEEEIKNLSSQISNRLAQTYINKQQLDINKLLNEFERNNPSIFNVVGGQLHEVINNIYKLFTGEKRDK